MQPDPRPTGPELPWGQLNRWAYCANDPVNASDPSGELIPLIAVAIAAAAMLAFLVGMLVGWWFMSNYCTARPSFWDELVALVVGFAITKGSEAALAAASGKLVAPLLAAGSVGGILLVRISVISVALVGGMVLGILLYDLLTDATPSPVSRFRGCGTDMDTSPRDVERLAGWEPVSFA